jgi:pimeloyl-ACP methyl ester carboxylesterase
MHLSAPTQSWLERGRHLTINGQRIFVHERGELGSPAIVFIHGFPTSGYDWREAIDLLADRFHCIALDLPGFGLSDKPVAYSYSLFQQADVVEGLARALGVEAAHVVSHDMGTSVHTELLARKHESRLGFTLLTSTFLNGSILKSMAHLTDFQRMLETPSRLPEAMQMCAELLPQYVTGLKQLMARPQVVTDDDAVVMTELLAYNDGHRRLPHVYAYVRERYLMQDRWLGALSSENDPVQLVWALDDPVAVIEMGRALAELAPKARFTEIPGVGHFLPLESPGSVADAIERITTQLGAQS